MQADVALQPFPAKATTPHSLECEQALLGTILSNPSAFAACDMLGPEDFFEPLHARMWEYIGQQMAATGKVLPLAVISQFRNDETLRSLGRESSAYIAHLMTNADIPATAKYLAQQIKNDATLRQMIETCNEVAEYASNPPVGETALSLATRAADTFAALGRVGQAGQHQMQNIIGQIMLAGRDENFRAGNPKRAVILRQRSGA